MFLFNFSFSYFEPRPAELHFQNFPQTKNKLFYPRTLLKNTVLYTPSFTTSLA